ncbi:polysaccharide deacetylase family protein [Indiicoccus explosivorum]|uniref:polysaccharide deacetylase family protein n=1 Tax=Indiicoccus explosivorum TaxID=1917864 RepID=UPI00138FD5FD|nr:polysaccharide deacetylase family protein [Indiicoccus explosivorum]
MKKCCAALIVLFATVIQFGGFQAEAADRRVTTLIAFTGEEMAHEGDLHALDLAAGHFSDEVKILPLEEVENLGDYSHVFYAGFSEAAVPAEKVQLFDNYTGKLLLIGHHINSFRPFADLAADGRLIMSGILDEQGRHLAEEDKVSTAFGSVGDRDIFYFTETGEGEYPLVFGDSRVYGVASHSISGNLADYLGEALFEFYGAGKKPPVKFLRLEDVHPKSDSSQLKEIGEFLAANRIPYAVTVIPVYVNPQTKEEIRLVDVPDLVETLKMMQKNGASLILHGYRHQYRDTETGEGYEYWDSEYDRPIYQSKGERVLQRADFSSQTDYEAFLKEAKEFEESYIAGTVEKGVSEMAALGLYPVAFEAPHYAMSRNGYKVLSEYFTTIVGEIQISDETGAGLSVSLFDSRPAKLNGMRVIPETLGYMKAGDTHAPKRIKEKAAYVSTFSDSYLAFFYHPYLGLDGLKDIMEGMQKYRDYEWIDLKAENHRVKTDGITITAASGNLHIERESEVKVAMVWSVFWWFAIPLAVFALILFFSIWRKWVDRNSKKQI